MIDGVDRSSPKFAARVAGMLFLVVILGGIVAQGVISDSLVVLGDAATTAKNITGNRGLIHVGYSVFLVEMACQILYTALVYRLLKPVGPGVATAAAFIELSGAVIKTFSRLFFILPLTILGSGTLTAFSSEQVQQLALLALQANDQGPAIALAFFGVSGLLNGYLIYRSTFLPRWLGLLSLASGLGWMTYLYPPLGSQLFLPIVVIALVGSAAQIFWLIVYGVDEERWKSRAQSMAAI